MKIITLLLFGVLAQAQTFTISGSTVGVSTYANAITLAGMVSATSGTVAVTLSGVTGTATARVSKAGRYAAHFALPAGQSAGAYTITATLGTATGTGTLMLLPIQNVGATASVGMPAAGMSQKAGVGAMGAPSPATLAVTRTANDDGSTTTSFTGVACWRMSCTAAGACGTPFYSAGGTSTNGQLFVGATTSDLIDAYEAAYPVP